GGGGGGRGGRRAAGSRRGAGRGGGGGRPPPPLPIGEQYEALAQKLRGHFLYYGVIGNRDCLSRFRYEVTRLWRKWLSRRHRRGQWSWERLNGLRRRFVLPWPAARGHPGAASP